MAARRERLVLEVLLDSRHAGTIYRGASGALRFVYDERWRTASDAYPLSISMPLAAAEHGDGVVSAFLWGLLPDNERTLAHYGRLFGVSGRSAVALLGHIGADCAGAVQLLTPEAFDAFRTARAGDGVEWLDEHAVANELRSARQRGIAGTTAATVGQFSLAGAQPKIALLHEVGAWGRPTGRIPTTHILKPPSGDFHGVAENEHFCLELAGALQLGAARSRVMRFEDEIAIVVDRFDRERVGANYVRIHQEDMCQALGVMPTNKYQSEGGPGIPDIINLLRDYSSDSSGDISRFLRATALNWVIAATDAHAKNYALVHGPGGRLRLAPFYDILSYLPYADAKLHRVKLAMRIGTKYPVAAVSRTAWERLARDSGLGVNLVLGEADAVVSRLPAAVERVASECVGSGLDEATIDLLRERLLERTEKCAAALAKSLY